MSQILPYETRSTVPFVLMTDTPDAVMIAIGFSDSGVLALVLIEAGALCVTGAVLGLVAARAAPMLAMSTAA